MAKSNVNQASGNARVGVQTTGSVVITGGLKFGKDGIQFGSVTVSDEDED